MRPHRKRTKSPTHEKIEQTPIFTSAGSFGYSTATNVTRSTLIMVR